MPSEVVAAVLLGALLHACWNAVVKGSPDKFLDTVLVCLGAAVIAAAALPFFPLPKPESWPFLALSVSIHVVYFSLVAAAYRAGDMSYTYPLMRGTAPLLVALASGFVLGEQLSASAWIGILLICGGVLGLALMHRQPRGAMALPTVLALGNAVVIACYSFSDGSGARLSGSAASYTGWLCLLTAPPMLAWAALRRSRAAMLAHFRDRAALGLFGGACTLASYALALWAMTQAPIAPVAALRETSILFGVALAGFVLKERLGFVRPIAAATVALGAFVLKIG